MGTLASPAARGSGRGRGRARRRGPDRRDVASAAGDVARRRAVVVMAIAVALSPGLVACSDAGADERLAGGGSDGADDAADATDSASSTDGVFTPAQPDGDADPADLGPVPPQPPDAVISDSVLDPIEPVPDTGVPGIDSADAFCRAWSEFAGSYQALTFGWAFRERAVAARHEVVANDILISAVDDLADSLPAELEGERSALTVELPTPLLRRADRARSLLADAGVDDAAVDALGAAWLSAVTEYGTESDALEVEIPAELVDQVEQAAQTLLGELPPITEDPSLIVDAQFPLTEQYLFANCPDRGTLAGNDRVD